MRDAIRQLRDDRRTIMLCTHNLAEAELLADRIAIIRRGKIIAEGSPNDLKRQLLGDPLMEVRLIQALDGLGDDLEGLVAVEDAAWEPRTSLVDFTTTRKGSPLESIMRLYKLTQADVTFTPTDESPSDFTVRLGSNYNPCSGTSTAFWRVTPTPSATPSAP